MSEWRSAQLIRMASEAEPMTAERWERMRREWYSDPDALRGDGKPSRAVANHGSRPMRSGLRTQT